MKRITLPPRADWIAKAEADGFTFHTVGQLSPDGSGTYWYESACYEFTSAEIDAIDSATAELHRLCMVLVDKVIADETLLGRFVPPAFREMVRASWKRRDPHLYGRMDLACDGEQVKLLEYNADTPTTLIETAKVQWQWISDVFPQRAAAGQQFNSLHEKLIARFGQLKAKMPADAYMHFSAVKENIEEFATVEYMRDLAYQASPLLDSVFVHMEDLGWDGTAFRDMDNEQVKFWFKLYPWEWLCREEFAPRLAGAGRDIGIIEPSWKMILSNKLMLPLLWQMYPGHKNLLEARFDEGVSPSDGEWIKKPALGREGGNISTFRDGAEIEKLPGSYGDADFIYQRRFRLPMFDGQYAIVGSWIVGDEPAGIIMRENDKPIIINTSRVVPHYFV